MHNLIIISFDISGRNDDSLDGENIAGKINTEIDKLIEIALQYISQHERVLMRNKNGAEIFYLGSAKEAMLMAIEFRDCMVAKNLNTVTPLFLRIGIHLETMPLTDNNQVEPATIHSANQSARLLKSQAKPNEILVSRRYFDHAPKSIQSIATVYELPAVDFGAGIETAKLITGKSEIHRVRRRQSEPALSAKTVLETTSPGMTDEIFLANRTTEMKPRPRLVNSLNWRYIALSVCVCLGVCLGAYLVYPSYLANLNLQRNANNVFPKTNIMPPAMAQQPAVVSQTVSIPAVTNQAEPVNSPVDRQPADKANIKRTDDKLAKDSKPVKPGKQTFWNKLANSMKQGKKSAGTAAEAALKQCQEK